MSVLVCSSLVGPGDAGSVVHSVLLRTDPSLVNVLETRTYFCFI